MKLTSLSQMLNWLSILSSNYKVQPDRPYVSAVSW